MAPREKNRYACKTLVLPKLHSHQCLDRLSALSVLRLHHLRLRTLSFGSLLRCALERPLPIMTPVSFLLFSCNIPHLDYVVFVPLVNATHNVSRAQSVESKTTCSYPVQIMPTSDSSARMYTTPLRLCQSCPPLSGSSFHSLPLHISLLIYRSIYILSSSSTAHHLSSP